MTSCDVKQINFKPPKYEATISMHHYVVGVDAGWYRISIVAMGRTEEAARHSAKALVEQAQAACMVASVELNRVPEAEDAGSTA